jgi:DNA repair exonuclease SbcCD ATPase subunit
MKSDRHRRTEIEREIQHGHKTREQLAALKTQIELLDKTVAGFAPVTQETVNASLQRCADGSSAVKDAKRGLAEATEARVEAETALAEIDGKDRCPFCGAEGHGWKSIRSAELAQQIDAHKEEEQKYAAVLADADVALRRAQKEHADLMAEVNRQMIVRNDRISSATAASRLEPELARLGALTEELARLTPENAELTARVETIQSELNVKNEEARNLEAAIAKAQQRAGDLVRMATAEKERDAAAKLKELAAAAGKELKDVQAGMVEGAFRPLLATANAVFAGVLPFELEYRDGEVGARAGGVWRGHKTMSGVERALTYCAIQMALAARAPVKVAVLDEMTKLVSKRVPKFAEQALQAIEDKLVDQVLIIDPERGALYRDTFTQDLSFNVVAVE